MVIYITILLCLNNYIHYKIKLRYANGTVYSFEGYGTYKWNICTTRQGIIFQIC